MKCSLCSGEASSFLKVCGNCIKKKWKEAKPFIKRAHEIARRKFGLPTFPPRNGLLCGICANKCRIPKGGKGYCGLVKNVNNKIVRLAGTPEKGLLQWYYDPLPTNCVNSWFCQSSKENGKNLAIFYGACSFSCLFCQNWHFKYLTKELKPLISAKELAKKVDEETKCICFFGGDPSPQILHAIETAKIVKKKVRICLETNGLENPYLLKKIAKLCFESGGTIKFDLKFWSEKLSIALSGTSNKQVYKNFSLLSKLHKKREEPFLSASTLLIPYYVDLEEIEKIVKFISNLDPSIPYSLLAFYGAYEMSDLPTTTRKFAEKCFKIAKEYLEKVRIGNVHLLS